MNFEVSSFSRNVSKEPWNAPGHSNSHTILIDSRDRDTTKYPNANSYRVLLPKAIRNVTSARLVSAEIPGTFYVFTSERGNTTLRVSVGATAHTITIPDGNYSASTMLTVLQTQLNDAFSGDGMTFEVRISETTMRYTITCTSHPLSTVSVLCSSGSPGVSDRYFMWGLGYYLGFNKADTSGTGSVTSPGVIDLSPERYMLLKIRNLNSVSECGMEGSGELRTAFAKIPFVVSSFGINFFDKLLSDNIMNPVKEKVEWFDIDLMFHDGSLVDFVGSGEHSFTIEVFCSPETM
jgi:hypothetical protein